MVYLDRLDDMRKLSQPFLSTAIHRKRTVQPFHQEVMTLGDERNHLSAFINIDFRTVDPGEQKRVGYTTFSDLSQNAK
jgi:hypothetical protein